MVNKPPEVGEFVGPQPAGVAIDMGGVQIADFRTLMVETDVPEQRLSQVKLGGPAEIVLGRVSEQALPRQRPSRSRPTVNRTKATVTVKVAFVDENEGVLPEMSARVSFLSGELDKEAMKAAPKVIVPGCAVVDLNGAKVVYRIESGVVRITPVTLGPAFGTGFEVHERRDVAGTRIVNNPPQGAGGRVRKDRGEERAMSVTTERQERHHCPAKRWASRSGAAGSAGRTGRPLEPDHEGRSFEALMGSERRLRQVDAAQPDRGSRRRPLAISRN